MNISESVVQNKNTLKYLDLLQEEVEKKYKERC